MACTYEPEEIQERKLIGLLIGCLRIVGALIVKVYADHLEQRALNSVKLHDSNTITASDYTVQMKITTKFYLQFVREHGGEKPDGISMVQHFKLWLKSKIETNFGKLPDDDFTDSSADSKTVMNITFTYDNSIVVKILAERGEALKDRDWDGVAKAEARIEELKRTNLKQLTYPTSAFITFRSEQGCFKAIRFNKLCDAMPQ